MDFLKSARSPLHTNLEEDYFAIHALAKFMYTSTASSFDLVSGPQIAYVVVHADEYAIQASRLVKNSQDFQKSLQQHLQKLLQEQVNVILLNLQKTEQQPPKFLRSLEDQVTVIPSLDQDSINAQSERLSEYLVRQRGLKQLVFTGGWKNACLKHTLRRTVMTKDPFELGIMDEIHHPVSGVVEYGKQRLEVLVTVDHDFVF
ncbi:MAG: hypothetical protein O2885_01475 [Proteobacteria bacterium]|nr:hypothetical protein [Pseudomonadota bacterium]